MNPAPQEIERGGPRTVLKAIWAAAIAALFVTMAVRAFSPLARLWDLESHASDPGQLNVYNQTSQGGFFGLPVELGDFDGDGKVDIVMAPMNSSGGNGTRTQSGEVYIYPGSGKIEGSIDRAAMPQPAGITIWGARERDMLGTELFTADVNGDGIQDLLMSAQNFDGIDGQRDSCGGAYVLLGRPGLLDGSRVIDLALADPAPEIIKIVGPEAGGRLGIWIEAGDLDGDGYADILIGADQVPASDPLADQYHNGLVVVIYGRPDFPRVIDLAEPFPGTSFIHGADYEDHFGSCLHARDLNGDGRAELIASAALNRLSSTQNVGGNYPTHGTAGGDGPGNTRPECGEVRIFFSLPEGQRLPPAVDLSQPLPPALEGKVTTIYGRSPQDSTGEELTSGDFNGDGFNDLAIGGLTGLSSDPLVGQSGIVHVLYWKPGLEGITIDLNPAIVGGIPEGLHVSTMTGLHKLDLLGDTLSAGDFNHDGIDDLAIGIPRQTVNGKDMAGVVAIAFGRGEPWPVEWTPQSDALPPQLQVAYILGRDAGDLLSYSMEARDFDGDGYADIFPNAMRGDGAGNEHTDAGEAYMVSGYRLTGAPVALESVEPPSGPASESTSVVIHGAGFTTSADTRLFAGEIEVRDTHVVTATKIEAVFPPSPQLGKVDVRLENRYGSASLPNAFERVASNTFIRGDSNLDGRVDISDPVALLSGLYRGAPIPCFDASDADDSGSVKQDDALYVLLYLYLGGPPPPAPFPSAGTDPTPDALGCR